MTKYLDDVDTPQAGPEKLAYREPDEPADGRPVVSRRPFWTDESERLTYEHAVETNPRRAGEGPGQYIARIAAVAAGRIVPRFPNAAGTMPRGRPGKAELQRKVAELEGQREPVGKGEA